MYDYLFGKVVGISNKYIILDVNGVGYKVNVVNNSKYKLNYYVKVYIFYHILENQRNIYGFYNKVDRDLFSRLLEIKKIGIKSAFLILSKYSFDDLYQIASNNLIEDALKIPKINKENYKSLFEIINSFDYVSNFKIDKEFLSILRSLDYSDRNIFEVYKKIDTSKRIDEQVKDAIKLMEDNKDEQ